MKIAILRLVHGFIILCAAILWMMAPAVLCAQLPFEECSDTEAWVPVGTGLKGRAVVSAEMDGKLYVVYSTFNVSRPDDSVFTLARLDGTTWTTVSTFTVSPRNEIRDLVVYKGELYLAGDFDWVNHVDSTAALAKWDGTTWKAVPGYRMLNTLERTWSARTRITVYKGELIAMGAFSDSLDNVEWGIVAYDGSSWRMIGRSSGTDTVFVEDFAEWRGDLFVSGRVNIDGVNMYSIARWNGSSWSPISNRPIYDTYLEVYDDKLYVFSTRFVGRREGSFLESWDGANWEDLTTLLSRDSLYRWFGPPAVAVHKGKLYILTTPGVITASAWAFANVALSWDGSVFRPIASPNPYTKPYTGFLISHNDRLYAGGNFTRSCSMITNYIARLCDSTECGGITGRVVEDLSGTCRQLETKPGIGGNIIEVLPGPSYVVTDSTGNYRFMAKPGMYQLRSSPPRYYQGVCPANDVRSVAVVTPGETLPGMYFAHKPIPNIRDLDVSIAGTRPRAGTLIRYTITCINRGTEDVERCVVRLRVEPSLEFDHAVPSESIKYPSTVEWHLDGMKRDERRTIDAYFMIPATMQFGTSICAYADVDARNIQHDAHPVWNFDSLCTPVLNSYDPNDIAVAPAGVGEQGLITPDDSVLTYTIRFQNNGNDTAYKVVVVDTLSPHLDVTSLLLGTSSHPSTLKFGEGGSLIWVFDRIMLPSDSVNEVASQGYLKYSVRLKRGLEPHTEITNRAGIYFDYNAPVLTNTVRTTIAPRSTSVTEREKTMAITLYPNPTRGPLHIRGDLLPGSVVRLENLFGELMYTMEADGDDMMIDLSDLPAGTYFVSHPRARTKVVKH